jgi:hypothetical protein
MRIFDWGEVGVGCGIGIWRVEGGGGGERGGRKRVEEGGRGRKEGRKEGRVEGAVMEEWYRGRRRREGG